MSTPRDIDGRYPAWAFPGGYPIVYQTEQGAMICASCVNKDPMIQELIDDRVVHIIGHPIECDNCKDIIESLFGPEDEGEIP